jgi:hypothetical protein
VSRAARPCAQEISRMINVTPAAAEKISELLVAEY